MQNIFFPTTSCIWSKVNEVATKNTEALEQDFKNHDYTTSEKVSNLVTSILDYGAIIQSVSSASLIMTTLSLTYSFFYYSPIVNALVMPVTVITLIFEAVISHDTYQLRIQFQELKEWTHKEFPDKEDAFFFDKKFYNRWVEFRKGIETNTFLVGYIFKNHPAFRGSADEMTKAFETSAKQHSFAAKAIISVAKNPSISTFKRLFGW